LLFANNIVILCHRELNVAFMKKNSMAVHVEVGNDSSTTDSHVGEGHVGEGKDIAYIGRQETNVFSESGPAKGLQICFKVSRVTEEKIEGDTFVGQ